MFRELSFEELNSVAGGTAPMNDPAYNSNDGGGWLSGLIDSASYGSIFLGNLQAQYQAQQNAQAALAASVSAAAANMVAAVFQNNQQVSSDPLSLASSYAGSAASTGSLGLDGAGDVIVTAPVQPSYYYQGQAGSASSTFSAGSGAGYQTANATSAANHFADAHIKTATNPTADDTTLSHEAHDDLAHLFDYATNNPGALIDIGNNVRVTASQVLADLSNVNYSIGHSTLYNANGTVAVRDDGSSIGGWARDVGNGTISIEFNTASPDTAGFIHNYQGTSGMDFEIFHETGHAIEYFENRPAYTYTPSANGQPYNTAQINVIEGSADRTMLSIEKALGIAQPTFSNGNIALLPYVPSYTPPPPSNPTWGGYFDNYQYQGQLLYSYQTHSPSSPNSPYRSQLQ